MTHKCVDKKLPRSLLCGIGVLGMISAPLAFGEDGDIQSLKNQVRDLQDKVQALESKGGEGGSKSAGSGIKAGPLTITLGGFTELATIYRNRNQTTDVASNWNGGIPFANSPNHDLSEFRESARQSRLSILTEGPEVNGAKGEAYFETDFLGAAPTANSVESNSYNLRMRHIYADYTTAGGFQILAGQNWSLLTMQKKGMSPRGEAIPLTIDAQYVPGFNWTRNPQVRVVQKFSDLISAGLSAESPQAIAAGNVPSGVVYNNVGVSQLNPLTTYTTDKLPDFIAKLSFDPPFGHYELYGMSRTFRNLIGGSDNSTTANSVGGSAVLPIVPKKFEVHLSALTGDGVGRYGSAQLPDFTFDSTGHIKPISETTALVGLIGYPTSDLTLYGYGGVEKSNETAVSTVGTTLYGYGNPGVNNSGCDTLGGTCQAQTKSISQITIGGWWKFYQGHIGYMQLGLQASHTKRETFDATSGGAPSASMNVVMASFRYYPYQK